MRILGDDWVAIRIHRLEVRRVAFAVLPQRSTGPRTAADNFLLEFDIRLVPVLQRHTDLAHHEVAATPQPRGSFVTDPYGCSEIACVPRPVLEAHQGCVASH